MSGAGGGSGNKAGDLKSRERERPHPRLRGPGLGQSNQAQVPGRPTSLRNWGLFPRVLFGAKPGPGLEYSPSPSSSFLILISPLS